MRRPEQADAAVLLLPAKPTDLTRPNLAAAAGLLALAPLGAPLRASGGERLQAEGIVAGGVANHATGVARALLQEDRLDARLIDFEIEALCGSEGHC